MDKLKEKLDKAEGMLCGLILKELETLNKNLEGYSRKLSNESFVAKAPAAVVAEEKRRQAEAQENKAKVEEALARIANF